LNKTLIIRFSSVGDIVLSSLLVRTFRKRFPECQLDFLVKEEYADVVRHNPHITNVITFPALGSFDDVRRLRSTIKQTDYDLVIDIHDSLRSRYVCLGARNVVRINKRKFARFLLVQFQHDVYSAFGDAPSVALRYLEPVINLGVADDGEGLEMFVSADTTAKVHELVRRSGFTSEQKFIGMCPSAKHNTKMWLKERFAEVASELSKKHNLPIMLFGAGDDEVQRSLEIESSVQRLNPEARTLNLAEKISLSETAAMMDYCSIVITNDSGLMHVAAARKRNVVAIFGPTVKQLGFFPFGTHSIVVENVELDCRPCTHIGSSSCPKGHFKCMNDISASQVVAAANTLLQ
jgi:lipopolysaccharide heptosyltransferase II